MPLKYHHTHKKNIKFYHIQLTLHSPRKPSPPRHRPHLRRRRRRNNHHLWQHQQSIERWSSVQRKCLEWIHVPKKEAISEEDLLAELVPSRTDDEKWPMKGAEQLNLAGRTTLFQEAGGMNSTLEGTLESKREKMTVREAEHKALEARKAAMVYEEVK
ncbi:hypothetical protein AKJ16_DCAP23135, partial [Drosera capensis]